MILIQDRRKFPTVFLFCPAKERPEEIDFYSPAFVEATAVWPSKPNGFGEVGEGHRAPQRQDDPVAFCVIPGNIGEASCLNSK